MRRTSGTICVLLTMAAVCALAIVLPASAGTRPVVTHLSAHRGPYWGGTSITIRGRNFTGVEAVTFGSKPAWSVDVQSSTELTAVVPYHSYARVFVRVRTGIGRSTAGSAAVFRFTRPSMDDPIQGGMTARQEQHRSRRVRAAHHNVHVARGARHWTRAMGRTALRRAESWIGVPYSWAGGNGRGPTTGVCAHNGGDLDCHVVGFDCSGLTLYAWWPYEHLVHYAATQHRTAGRFHPTIGQLVPGDLVFFSGYIANGIGHTAIYAGHGMVIQAPESGQQVMRSRLVDVIANSGVYRGATRPTSTGRQGSGPHVASVTHTVSADGGRVVVTGRHLAGVTSVSIGGVRQYHFSTRTSHHLAFSAPAHTAGRVHVTVSNAWGSARRRLTYVAAPTTTALSPATGPTGGATAVTVSGSHLSTVTSATVAGRRVPVDVLGPHRARLTVPAHAAGPVTIVLTSRYGSSAGLTYTYVVVAPAPTTTAPTQKVGRPRTPTSGTSTPTGSPSSGSPSSGSPSSGPPPPSTAAPTTGAPTTGAPTSTAAPGTTAPAASPSG